MALTRLGPNQSVNLASNVTGTLPTANLPTGTVIQVVGDENAVRHLAKQLNITPVDVRSIAHQGGDWARIAKRLDISTDVVKVVKVSIGGV